MRGGRGWHASRLRGKCPCESAQLLPPASWLGCARASGGLGPTCTPVTWRIPSSWTRLHTQCSAARWGRGRLQGEGELGTWELAHGEGYCWESLDSLVLDVVLEPPSLVSSSPLRASDGLLHGCTALPPPHSAELSQPLVGRLCRVASTCCASFQTSRWRAWKAAL